MKNSAFMRLLSFCCSMFGAVSFEAGAGELPKNQISYNYEDELQNSDSEERLHAAQPFPDVLLRRRRRTPLMHTVGDTQALGQPCCVESSTAYFQSAFSKAEVATDDRRLETILAEMRAKGFGEPFVAWLAHQGLKKVAMSSPELQGVSPADSRQRRDKMMMALPDEQTWQRWCVANEFHKPGKSFTAMQVMQVTARLLLAAGESNARSRDIYVCPASGSRR